MFYGQLKIAATTEEWSEEIGDDLNEYFHRNPLFPAAPIKKIKKFAHSIPILKDNQSWQGKAFVGSHVNHKNIPHVLNELKKGRMHKPLYDPKNQNINFDGTPTKELRQALNKYKVLD